ncbi:MAG: sugar ABC transporter ATP-binding protein [Planctomycetaceae bacterium]
MLDSTRLLTLSGISKSFGGVQALRGVSFELRAGEVHALVGENGAGKSTLVKIITGAHQPDAGAIELSGAALGPFDPQTARGLGIAAIYQQPALFPDLSVAENISLGLDPPRFWRRIGWTSLRDRAARLLAQVGAHISPEVEAGRLSMPEQQLVEIARAVACDARVLILDEPTASLSDSEVDRLFAVISRLRSQGVGMIYISHRLEELSRIADRITVLRDGRTVATTGAKEWPRAELIRLMVGRELSAVFPKTDVAAGKVLLETRRLSAAAGKVRDVSLVVRAGEIVGLAGLVGAGRTELARTLFGLTPAERGEILVAGRPQIVDSPASAMALGIAYVPEDRRRHGVILDFSVAANTSLAALGRLSHRGLFNFRRERRLARSFVDRLAIKTPSIDSPVGHLSGGNQQKVAVARWLVTEPTILILDEPTQGVDVGAKTEIHRLMSELAAQGMGILMITSDLPEALGMSDRIVVMHAGTITGELARGDATQERVLELALGHVPAGRDCP